jgi:hypothetical protein
MTIWYTLEPFAMFSGHLLYFPHFGTLYQEKSGNPGVTRFRRNFATLETNIPKLLKADFIFTPF